MKREPITNLEVIGYADRVNEELAPTIVPPIFRALDKDLVFMPPFQIVDDHAEAHITGTTSDFLRFVARSGTAIDPPIPAQPKHILWIDKHLQPRYEALVIVRERIGALEQEALRQFAVAEQSGDFATARAAVGSAISMSSRTAMLLKVRILEHEGKPELARIVLQAAGEPA